jgi:hypothetical protein
MPGAVFEPKTPVTNLKTHALDRTATKDRQQVFYIQLNLSFTALQGNVICQHCP